MTTDNLSEEPMPTDATPESGAEAEESFADLLSAYERSHAKPAETGSRQLEGVIVSLTDERAFLELALQYGWQIHFYAAFELAAVPVPNPSETVRRHTGTPSVSEAAALLVAHTDATQLIVEKHRLRGSDGRSATVSIARIPE